MFLDAAQKNKQQQAFWEKKHYKSDPNLQIKFASGWVASTFSDAAQIKTKQKQPHGMYSSTACKVLYVGLVIFEVNQ